MTATTGPGDTAAPVRTGLATAAQNLADWLVVLFGPPRRPVRTTGWRVFAEAHRRQAMIVLGLVIAVMLLVDPFDEAVKRLPKGVIDLFEELTDYGRSGWVLIPTGGALVVLAALLRPTLDRWSRAVLAAMVVRVGFVFVAVGLPSLVATIVKRWIGRLRPSELGPFVYVPFSWDSAHASLPSGHTVTAFAALVAIGAVWPAARAVLWAYALTIAASRIIVHAHFPSDVLAGAAFGAFGAVLVREWFAARRLGFVTDPDGTVRTLPGPSAPRVLRALAAAAER